MSSLDRALVLLSQRRYDLAESEIRRYLNDDPQSGKGHALLALAIGKDQDRLQEASEIATRGVSLEPDEAFVHYVLSQIYDRRNRLPESLDAINEAIRLDSYDAAYFAQRASVYSQQRKWNAALADAQSGLEIDPDHLDCRNLRTISLERLGRGGEASQSAAETVRQDPESTMAHTSMGWAQLNNGKYTEAQKSFREALRLDPNNELARDGMITSMHGRSFVFRAIHRFYVAFSRFSFKYQFLFIVGAWILMRLLDNWGAQNPAIQALTIPVMLLYLLFAFSSWILTPLFNTFLRFDQFGRHLLNRGEIWASNLLAVCGITAVVGIAFSAAWDDWFLALVVGFYWIAMMVPVSIIFQQQSRRRAAIASVATLVVAGIPVWGVINSFMAASLSPSTASMTGFIWGILILQIGSNLLQTQPVRR